MPLGRGGAGVGAGDHLDAVLTQLPRLPILVVRKVSRSSPSRSSTALMPGAILSGGGDWLGSMPRVGSTVIPAADHVGQHLVGRDAAGLGEAGEVLDSVHPGADGLPDAAQRMRVRQHPQSGRVPGRDARRAARRRLNWGAYTLVPGVTIPPLAITLMTSTPRSACSSTARRTPSTPDDRAAEVVAVAVRDGQWRAGRDHPREPGVRRGARGSGSHGRRGPGPS